MGGGGGPRDHAPQTPEPAARVQVLKDELSSTKDAHSVKNLPAVIFSHLALCHSF